MFALAVWNERAGEGLLARDRLGVKPLYYHVDGRRLVFGSELRAILAAPGVPRQVDPAALLDYLVLGFIPAPRTIFRGICKLPAGSLLRFRAGRAEVRSWWDLNHRGWLDGGIDVAADALWERLLEATRLRMIADVPLGAFLSGGLDSAAVAAAMCRQGRGPVCSLTCGFDEPGFDERTPGRETARVLATHHEEMRVRPEVDRLTDLMAGVFDEPFADASAIPMYHLSQEARRRVTVALSGDGGDEVLAGYRRYRFDRYEETVRRTVPRAVRRAVFGRLGGAWPSRRWMPRALRAGATLRNLAADGAAGHAQSIATMRPEIAVGLLRPDLAEALGGYDPLEQARALYARSDAPDHLSRCQYTDIRLGLAEGILTKVDRASMAHALEVRSPLLDYRLVELAWTIQPGLRLRGMRGKWPLRHAVCRHVAPSLSRRPKHGFEVPLDAWFRGPLGNRFQDEVLSPGAAIERWIEPAAARAVWDDHAGGRRDLGPALWKLAMLEAWARRYLAGAVDRAGIRAAGGMACIR
jgi:asparagine synthase (glutamine-hydrolysing)